MYDPPARFCARDGTPLVDVELPRAESPPEPVPPPPPPLIINQLLDARFRVLRRIGEGGMAHVYQGKDQKTGAEVAIKVLSPRLADDEGAMQRLKREAMLAERFSHANVCRTLHVGECEGKLYLVMPYLRGESLNESETRRGPYPVGEAILLLVQTCQGLQHAHDLGVVHRDLKPENIMLVPDDGVTGGVRAVVMDFGLGKAIHAGPELLRLTQTGIVLGTPEFMSPEQVRGEAIDGRSDIFALGVVGFELLTGQLPFAGRTSQDAMLARLKGKARNARAIRPDLPARMEAVLARALALKVEQRYQTMQSFADDLASVEDRGLLQRWFG